MTDTPIEHRLCGPRSIGDVIADYVPAILGDAEMIEAVQAKDPLRTFTAAVCELYWRARAEQDVKLSAVASDLLLEVHKQRCRLRTP